MLQWTLANLDSINPEKLLSVGRRIEGSKLMTSLIFTKGRSQLSYLDNIPVNNKYHSFGARSQQELFVTTIELIRNIQPLLW